MTKMPERSQGIFPVTDGTIFMDTDSRKCENGTSCRKGESRTNNNSTVAEREKADKVITTAKGTKIFISYPTDVSDVVRQEKINHIYDILTQHKSE